MSIKRAVLLILIGILLLSGCSNRQLYGTSSALIAVDWMQTRYIAESDDYYELNPILGRNPTTTEVDIYFASSLAVNTLVYKYAPEHLQPYYFWPVIGLQTLCVTNNGRIGVGMSFPF